MGKWLSTIFLIFSTLPAYAHPVSYKDGLGIMSYNSKDMNELLLTYSFTPKFAFATTYLRDSKSEFYIPRANFLLHRWNNDDSQANVYLSAGSGVEKYDGKTTSVNLGELVADWESRKYYVYFEHLYLNRNTEKNLSLPDRDYNHTKFRLGFAPFLADYSDLNVWFITQFDRHLNTDQIEASQFLRFYIRNVLWEVGAGFDGSFKFNFMIHL